LYGRLATGQWCRWPKTRPQRDWFHKLGNILDKLPKRLQPRVKAALHEVMYAETREQAREAIARFGGEYGAKYPKAVATLEKDADVLLTFFDFPAEHWTTWRRRDGVATLRRALKPAAWPLS
jgi:putative transposase